MAMWVLGGQWGQTWCMMWMLYVKSICRIAHDEVVPLLLGVCNEGEEQ